MKLLTLRLVSTLKEACERGDRWRSSSTFGAASAAVILFLVLTFNATSPTHAQDAKVPFSMIIGYEQVAISWIDLDAAHHMDYVVQWTMSDFDPTISDMELDDGWWVYNGVNVLGSWGNGRYAEVYNKSGSYSATVWLSNGVVKRSPSYDELRFAQVWAQNAIADYYDEPWLYAHEAVVKGDSYTITGLTSKVPYKARLYARYNDRLPDYTFSVGFSFTLDPKHPAPDRYSAIGGNGEIVVSWIDDNPSSHSGYTVQWDLSSADFDPTISDMELDDGWWVYNGVNVLGSWGNGRYAEVYNSSGSYSTTVWLSDGVVKRSPSYDELRFAQVWAQNAIEDYYDEPWLYAKQAFVKDTSYTITGLANGVSYKVMLRAVNNDGSYDDSMWASFGVMLDKLPPTLDRPNVTGGKELIQVSWQKLATQVPPIQQYTVQWRAVNFDPYTTPMEVDPAWKTSDGTYSYVLGDPESEGSYAKISVVNSAGQIQYRPYVWLEDGTYRTTIYTDLKTAQLWAQYIISEYYDLDLDAVSITVDANTTSATITGLIAGDPYDARVRAVNYVGPGDWSEWEGAFTYQ